ncbi:hypothetical protein LTR17_018662 [Elasticomyces elasticus]|nr:hypothetical protein LTR17_018662 [Elasticomyces elasticus]
MAFFANNGVNVFDPTRLDQASVHIITTDGQGQSAHNAPFANQHMGVSHSWPDFAAASQAVASANQPSTAHQDTQMQQQSQAAQIAGYHGNMPVLDPALVTANHHDGDVHATLGGTSDHGNDETQELSNDIQGHGPVHTAPAIMSPQRSRNFTQASMIPFGTGHGLPSSSAGPTTGTNRTLQPTGYQHPALEDFQHPALEDFQHQHLQTLFGDQDHGEAGNDIHENADEDEDEDQDADVEEDESSGDNAVPPGMVRTAAGTIRTLGYNIDFLGAPEVTANMYRGINGAVEDIYFFPNHGAMATANVPLTEQRLDYARDELFLPDGTVDRVKWERCRNKLKYQANAAGRTVFPNLPDWTPNRYPGTLIPINNYSAAQYLPPGHRVNGLHAVPLYELARNVVRLPGVRDRHFLSQAVEWVIQNGDMISTTNDIDQLAQTHGFVVPPESLLPQWDQNGRNRALGRLRALGVDI